MQIRVKVNLLSYSPGQILKEGDKWYEDFKAWAVKKSTRNGALIAEVCDAPAKTEPEEAPGPTGYIRPEEAPAEAPADEGDTSWRGEKRMKAVRAAKNGPVKGKAE